MPATETLYLRLAVDRLTAADPDHYAIWVVDSPYPGGYVHHDCVWSHALTQAWQSWQQMFSLRGLPQVPHVPSTYVPQFMLDGGADGDESAGFPRSYSSRLMQHLGVNLWQWLFDGPIQRSLDQSLGIAMGQNRPLHLRVELRDPELISLPWEIMQQQSGRQAISLSQQIVFSRTTSDVDPLPDFDLDSALRVLLVLGHDDDAPVVTQPMDNPKREPVLQLQEEAIALKTLLEHSPSTLTSNIKRAVVCQVNTLLQPTPAELIDALESGLYNLFFYAGHGVPAPDGGLLFLGAESTLNGTELAQVLTRCQVKLAVFNTCWGAQPDQSAQQPIPRSSLAEVMLHHGVPAVLAMRDSIADEEALSFIQVFAQSLAERVPVDQSVAIARQHLLTLYKFNQPAWTLPVLYMHPEFDGVLLNPVREDITRLPSDTGMALKPRARAFLRAVDDHQRIWPIYGGLMRVGRLPDNDLPLSDPWVSSKHAEIFCRISAPIGQSSVGEPVYYLRDFSRNGTFCRDKDAAWKQIQRQEILLTSGTQLRFGSSKGRVLEFVVEGITPLSHTQSDGLN